MDNISSSYEPQFNSKRFFFPEDQFRVNLREALEPRNLGLSGNPTAESKFSTPVINADVPVPQNSRTSLFGKYSCDCVIPAKTTQECFESFDRSLRKFISIPVIKVRHRPLKVNNALCKGGCPVTPVWDKLRCIERFLSARAEKVTSPHGGSPSKTRLSARQTGNLKHSPEKSYYNAAYNAIWQSKRPWPLYKLKRSFRIFYPKTARTYSQLYLCGRRIRIIPQQSGRDSVYVRYTSLCSDSSSQCDKQRSPFPSLKDAVPYSERHPPSASDVIKYLLESHPAFHSPDGFRAATPAVTVGGEKHVVDTKFIHNLNEVLDDERFARHTSTPDAKALTAARVTIHALENSGLLDSLRLLEHNPEAVFGGSSGNLKISSFTPVVGDFVVSPDLGRVVDSSAATSIQTGIAVTKAHASEELKSEQRLSHEPGPEHYALFNNGAHMEQDKQISVNDTAAERKAPTARITRTSQPQEARRLIHRSLSKSLGETAPDRMGFRVSERHDISDEYPDAARNVSSSAEQRNRLLSLKNELKRKEEQAKLEAIIKTTFVSDNFAEVVRKRTLINKRKREAGLASAKRVSIGNEVDDKGSPPAKKSARDSSMSHAKQKANKKLLKMDSLPARDSLSVRKKAAEIRQLDDLTDAENADRSAVNESEQQPPHFFGPTVGSDSENSQVTTASLQRILKHGPQPLRAFNEKETTIDGKHRQGSDKKESGSASDTAHTEGQIKLPASVIRRTRIQQSYYRRLRNRLPKPTERKLSCQIPTRRYASGEDWEKKGTGSRQKLRYFFNNAVEQLTAHGRHTSGYEAANRNIEHFPLYPQAFLNRAQLCEANNREASLKDLSIAVSLNGLDEKMRGEALLDRGLIYMKLGQNRSALRDIKESKSCSGYCPESALALAVHFYEQKEYFRSEIYFGMAIGLTPAAPATLWLRYRIMRALALLLYRAQKYSIALDIWNEASMVVASPDSLYFLFSAMCHRRLGHYEKAETFFRAYLKLYPLELRKDLLRAIYVHLLLGDNDQALCHLQNTDPLELFFNPKLLILSARLFWNEGSFPQSRHCLQHCLTAKKLVHPANKGIDCGSRVLAFLQILMNVRQRKYEEAFHLCKIGRQRWENDYRFSAWFAFLKYESGLEWDRKPSATQILQELTETYPDNCFIWYARARCACYLRRNHRKALNYLTTAIKLAPGFHAAYYFRACVRIRLGVRYGAFKDIQRCCKAYPDSVQCWAVMGYCAVQLHLYKTALAAFLKTVGMKPRANLNWLLLVRAWVFWKFKLYSKAMGDFHILAKRFPNNIHAIKGLTLTTWQCRGQRYVTSVLRKHQRMMDANPTLWVIYALSFFYQSHPETYSRTKVILQKILHAYPQHYLARFNLGVVFYWERQYRQASAIFEAVRHAHIEITAGKELQTTAYGALGILLFLTSQHRRALGILEAVANSPYLDEYFYVTFGYIRLVMKLPVEAEHAFHRACQLDPLNDEIRFLIGGLYMLFNYAGKAVSYYTMVLNGNTRHIRRLACLNRCMAYKQLGLYKKALADISHLADDDSVFQKTHRTLIQKLYLNTKKQMRKQDRYFMDANSKQSV